MTPKITWLLIDIGNVLLLKDSGHSYTELLANELGVDMELTQEINKAHYTTMDRKFIPEDVFVSSLENELGINVPKDIFSYFARAYDKQVRPNTELFRFLETVRANGVKTAVLSNTTAIYQGVQEKFGITKENGFDPILYSWQVEMVKPNKDIFDHAIQELRAEPAEVIFIDDKQEHLEGARAVGLQTVLFDTTENVISQLRELGVVEKL